VGVDGCCKITGYLIAGPRTGQLARSQFLRTPAPGLGYYESNAMKKSVAVRLTVVAAVGIAARAQPRQDPCSAATFNEQACQAAVQNRGYCWNGRWVGLKYHYPFPYYYDAYLDYVSTGGVSSPAAVVSCGPTHRFFSAAHGISRAGFGSSGGGCHAAHG
jgi:hypothetical protein